MKVWRMPSTIAKRSHLTGDSKILYTYLLNCPDAAEHPVVRDIAADCGCDQWTTRNSIRKLESAGLIRVTRQGGDIRPRLTKIKVLKNKGSTATKTRSTKRQRARVH